MVFRGAAVVGMAKLSANTCQYIACNPQRLPTDQVLHLLFCFPLQQLRRLAFWLWTILCLPYPDTPYLTSSSSSSSLSSSSSDFHYQEVDLYSD